MKEKIDEGSIEVEFTPTLLMLAEMFIKPLLREHYKVIVLMYADAT